MPRPRRDASAPPTPDRVLDAAEAAFARDGLDAARLEDIARAVGITRPSLLYHFDSKDRLYAEVVRRALGALDDALAAAIAREGAFEARLAQVVDRFEAFLAERPTLAALLLRELLDGRGPGRERLVAALGPVLDRVDAFVRAEGSPVDGLDVRAAVLDLAAAALVRAAAADVRDALWRGARPTPAIARALFSGGPP